MKENQVIIAFVIVAALVFSAGLAYKIGHHVGTKTATQAVQQQPSQPSKGPVIPKSTWTLPEVSGHTHHDKNDALDNGVLKPVFFVQASMKALHTALIRAFNLQKVKLIDLDKLSFGGPESAPDPEYNVWNPQGRIQFQPQRWITQDIVDQLTTQKGTPLVYNLRRIVDKKGTISETFYAIIPNFAPENCGRGSDNDDYTYTGSITIAPDTSTIVEDPADMPVMNIGCLHMPGDKIAWFYKLKLRTKARGSSLWTSY